MKICKKCGIEKDALQFRLRKRKSGNGYYRMNQCKSCEKECGRIYYHKYKHTEKYEQQKKRNRVRFKENGYHKHRYKIWGRNYKLQKEFGITESDYKKMLKEQKGLCAICEQPETRYVNCSDKIKPGTSLRWNRLISFFVEPAVATKVGLSGSGFSDIRTSTCRSAPGTSPLTSTAALLSQTFSVPSLAI